MIPYVDLEGRVAKVEEKDPNCSSIVGIDDASADVHAELGGESAARSDAAVSTFRDG